MSKELVISAASHERRVAILEDGQLVEIYIEREKEFALVGSIYKGKVTRVLPGMQSAFVDIGLDGDAFLYVSDVFENLEDYDHGHAHDVAAAPPAIQVASRVVEMLPGETLGHGDEHEVSLHADQVDVEHHDPASAHDEDSHIDPHNRIEPPSAVPEHEIHEEDERQPESNASAPQNFAPHYNPTKNYPARGSDRPSYGRSNQGDRSNDRGGNVGNGGDRGADRGGDRGRNRFGKRGGRRRSGGSTGGGRPQGGAPAGGRTLPPSKYASPQGESRSDSRGDSRGNEQPRSSDPRNQFQRGSSSRGPSQPRSFEPRGAEPRGFENRRPAAPAGEEPILLPGESLAKYRGKPVAAPVAPVEERPAYDPSLEMEETPRHNIGNLPSAPTSGGAPVAPRRSAGVVPRWLLADAGSESEAAPVSADENIGVAEDAAISAHGANPSRHAASPLELPDSATGKLASSSSEVELDEEDAIALSSGIVEAKHEEVQEEAEADALAGGAVFEEEEDEEEVEEDAETEAEIEAEAELELEEQEEEEGSDEESAAGQAAVEAPESAVVSQLTDEETEELEKRRAERRRHFAADAAQESAEHAVASGQIHEHSAEELHTEVSQEEGHEEGGTEELLAAHAPEIASLTPAATEDDVILLPGETRAPRSASAPREDFPRDSARVGGNPRSRFQRPFRSGGRDRGRDSRGGRPDSRGPRPERSGDRSTERSGDRGSSRPPQRFERRPSGGPRHDRGHHGGHSSNRRPQLISEMLKAGQDVVIQIAKEPLGKKGARITSHVALPGRFLVYMPTVDHIGVSRKIAAAENRSRLRRLVGEARGSYPGGFIVRTAAGDATDDEIRTDIEFLGKTWHEIKERSEQRKSPALLHRDLDLVERMLRDYVSDDFTAIWIDNEEEYGKVVEFVSRFQPKLVNRVKLYTKDQPIFEEFGIQHELDKALRAKVWLKSGGYIVINHTEALVAIDVNTGKFVGKGSVRLEDTIVKTNLEAVKEIVRQIRLRDLGGIIVVDFIDMEERRNRDKVLFALQQALEQDKAPSKALSFNEFGLVCITRKRTKQALERVLCQPCPYCTGSGMVKSIPTLCYEIQAEGRKMAAAGHEGPNLTLRVHPEIAKALKTRESMLIDELEQTAHKHIIIQSDATLHWEQYDIY